ncbi:MAG: TolC family protein [Gammaproteobacteria bacterium]
MIKIRLSAVVMAASLLWPAVTSAAENSAQPQPLLLDEVLASSARYFPQILESLAGRRAAEGSALEAEGAFDLVFSADGNQNTGYYDSTALKGGARQRLRTIGGSVYSDYKLSNGNFPVYQDNSFTNTGGSFRVGMLFSLLRDRSIDPQRFGVIDARLNVQEASLDVLLTRIGVQERALVAYWDWVAKGRQLGVYEELLQIAIERQDGLEGEVERGARAEIFLTENQQNITRRQILVTSAQRDLALATNLLSLYYRDQSGRPAAVSPDRLPPGSSIEEVFQESTPPVVPVSEALTRRPELAILRTAIEREQNRISLAENQLKPRLDFFVEAQQGLGAVAEGGASRDGTNAMAGFTFSIPLQQRAGRGRLQRAQANLDARQQQQRLREDQIDLEIRNLLVDLNISRDLLMLADQEVQQSEIMRDSEQRRFDSGASDFFLLNIREETAANARIRLLEAELQARIARANYDAATVDVERLGIDEPE